MVLDILEIAIGSIFISGKLLEEKSNTKQYNSDLQELNARKNELISRVCDSKIEDIITEDVKNIFKNDLNKYNVMCDEMVDFLRSFENIPVLTKGFFDINSMILMQMLYRYNKVPRYQIDSLSCNPIKFCSTGRSRDLQISFYSNISKMISEPLYYISYCNCNNIDKADVINTNGALRWESTIIKSRLQCNNIVRIK